MCPRLVRSLGLLALPLLLLLVLPHLLHRVPLLLLRLRPRPLAGGASLRLGSSRCAWGVEDPVSDLLGVLLAAVLVLGVRLS